MTETAFSRRDLEVVAELAAPPRYTIEDNADGSRIVKLAKPVRLADGRVLERLTLPALTGRHLKLIPWALSTDVQPTFGQAMSWASAVVEPHGVLDELDGFLARDIGMQMVAVLGKGPSR